MAIISAIVLVICGVIGVKAHSDAVNNPPPKPVSQNINVTRSPAPPAPEGKALVVSPKTQASPSPSPASQKPPTPAITFEPVVGDEPTSTLPESGQMKFGDQ